MFVLAEANDLELPLLVADSLPDLARLSGAPYPTLYKAYKNGWVTRAHHGTPARVYMIQEDKDDGS